MLKLCSNKNCPVGQPQPIENFSRDGNSYRSRCKSCQHADYLLRKDKKTGAKPLAKLDQETVKRIRADWQGGLFTLDELSKKYRTDVRRVVYNRAYVDENYVPKKRNH